MNDREFVIAVCLSAGLIILFYVILALGWMLFMQ